MRNAITAISGHTCNLTLVAVIHRKLNLAMRFTLMLSLSRCDFFGRRARALSLGRYTRRLSKSSGLGTYLAELQKAPGQSGKHRATVSAMLNGTSSALKAILRLRRQYKKADRVQ